MTDESLEILLPHSLQLDSRSFEGVVHREGETSSKWEQEVGCGGGGRETKKG